jgi:tetratricopeptide (TPR) repeat protein
LHFAFPFSAAAQNKDLDEETRLISEAARLINAAKWKNASAVLERALPLTERLHGPKSEQCLQLLNALGMSLENSGQFRKGAETYERLLAIQQETLGKGRVEVAKTLHIVGRNYTQLKDYRRADGYFQESIAVFEAQLGKETKELVEPLVMLGGNYLIEGKYLLAEPLLLRGVNLADRHKDLVHQEFGLSFLQSCYDALGQYSKAEPVIERLLKHQERLFGPNDPSLCSTLHSLGHMYWKMGQYADAEKSFLRSAAIGKEKAGTFADTNLNTLNCLSVLYWNTGRREESLKLRQRIFEHAEKQLAPDHPFRVFMMLQLGRDYVESGDLARAEPLLLGGLEKVKKLPGNRDEGLFVATLYRLQGKYDLAEQMIRDVLKWQGQRYGPSNSNLARTWTDLALVQAARQRPQDAGQSLHNCLRILRRHVAQNLPMLSPEGQLGFLTKTYEEDLFIGLSLAMQHPEDANLTQLAAEWLVNSKGLSHESLATTNRLLLSSPNTEVTNLVRELQLARFEIARLTLSSGDTDEADKSLPSRTLGQKRLRARELEKKVQRLVQKELPAEPWVPLWEVRSRLPRDAALVEIVHLKVRDFQAKPGEPVWGPPRYVAWVVPPPAQGAVRFVDLGDAAAIDAMVQTVRRQVGRAAPNRGVTREDEPPDPAAKQREALERLSRAVLHPLLPELAKRPRWVLGPDADLWLVPWCACLLPDGSYVVAKHAVSLVTSGRNLAKAPRRTNGEPALVLADPDYDLGNAKARQVTRALLGTPAETRAVPPTRNSRPGPVARLPGTAAEAEAVVPQVKTILGAEPRVLLREKAIKDVVLAHKNPDILVLSTHAYVLPRATSGKQVSDNPLLRCGLLLAGCNDNDYFSQGVLTGWEVTNMDLRGTHLVVLSACETGLGEVQQGEGVAGLRQAFQLAGAETVVASLWQVPDRETAHLMSRFFANMAQEEDKAEALRHAQLRTLRADGNGKKLAHPYYWAAFSVTGLGHTLFPLPDSLAVGPPLESAGHYVSRGQERLRQNRPRLAVADFSAAIDKDPQQAVAYSGRAAAYKRLGKADAARVDLDRRLALGQPEAADLIEHARLLRSKQPHKALEDLNQALALDPQSKEALAVRAYVYHFGLKKTGDALADLDRAVQLDPRFPEALNLRGLIYRDQKLYPQAMEDLNRCLEADPTFTFAWINRGIARARQNDLAGAVADMSQAIELSPDTALYWLERGKVYMAQQRLAPALDDLSRALALGPKNNVVLANRSDVYRRLGRFQEAIQDATQAVELNPGNSFAMATRGEVYLQMKAYDKAVEDYSKALAVSPRYLFALNGRGRAHVARNEHARAEKDFSRCIAVDPTYKFAWVNRAHARLLQKKTGEALADASRALAIDPNYVYAYRVRARIYRELGDAEKARADEARATSASGKSNR